MNILISIGILYIFSCLFVFVDNTIDNIYYWIRKKLNGNKEIVTESTDVFEALENSWIRDKYLNIFRFFLHVRDFPVNFYYETKYFIQRGVKGYSDRDCWSIDCFLINILPDMIKQLKKNSHGCPILKGYKNWDGNDEEFEMMRKDWKNILNSIIETFDTAKSISQKNWYYQESRYYSKKRADKYREINKRIKQKLSELYDENYLHVMTKEECKKYEQGWKYFQKYFFNLWD